MLLGTRAAQQNGMGKTIIVAGLRDGQHSCNTKMLMQRVRAAGGSVVLAKTGRVKLTNASGIVTTYVLFTDCSTGNSPLTQALADLSSASPLLSPALRCDTIGTCSACKALALGSIAATHNGMSSTDKGAVATT
jgi:hypothetical protein